MRQSKGVQTISGLAENWKSRADTHASAAIETGDFTAYRNGITHTWLRTLMLLIFSLVPVFFLLDVAIMPADLLPRFAVYRGVCALIGLIQFIIVINTKPSRLSFLHGYVASLHVGGMIVLMTADLGGFSSGYYAGLNLIIIGVNLLIPWGAWNTLGNSAIVLFMYLGLNLISLQPGDPDFIINNLYFLLATIVIVAAINYLRLGLVKREFGLLVQVEKARKAIQVEKDLLDERNQSIKNLLDVSGQGFLSFNEKFLVSPEYSRECENIFERSIDKSHIDDLLFPDESSRSIFRKGLELFFSGQIKPEVVFDLLDPELSILDKKVKIQYKAVHSARVMVALTDSTEEQRLLELSRRETEKWNMLRNVIANRQAFTSFSREGKILFVALQIRNKAYEVLLRDIHTLKASAGMLGFIQTQSAAHVLEDFLSDRIALGQIPAPDVHIESLTYAFDAEMRYVREALGKGWDQDIELITIPRDGFSHILHYVRMNYPDGALIEKLENLRRITLATSLARYSQMTADLGSRLGKRVAPLLITGGNITVIADDFEVLIESFTHLIRNMVDHGIEFSAEREAKGKPSIGLMRIAISESEGQLTFLFSDDGRGISFTDIAEKALKMGLLARGDTPSHARLYQLLFSDNFSTNKTVSEISGRGIGLSAVRQAVRGMRGRISVRSKDTLGTTITITVPNHKPSTRMEVRI